MAPGSGNSKMHGWPKMHSWDDVCEVVPGGKPEHIGGQKTGTPGLRPTLEDPAMTRYLFLKFDRIGHLSAPRRPVTNSGLDIKMLLLLGTRYV